MKISKKEDYGLILMRVLAKKYSPEYIPLSVVASETHLSGLFLKHLASKLLDRKLVESKEGITGGYRLTRRPEEIDLAQIMEAISDGMMVPSCNSKKCIVKKDKCACFSLWHGVNGEIFSYLKKIKLSDFAGK